MHYVVLLGIFHCVYATVPQWNCLSIHLLIVICVLSSLGCYKQSSCEHLCLNLCEDIYFSFLLNKCVPKSVFYILTSNCVMVPLAPFFTSIQFSLLILPSLVDKEWYLIVVFNLQFPIDWWRRQWPPTPVFLPGEPQGRGSLVGCHLWGRTVSDTIEAT